MEMVRFFSDAFWLKALGGGVYYSYTERISPAVFWLPGFFIKKSLVCYLAVYWYYEAECQDNIRISSSCSLRRV